MFYSYINFDFLSLFFNAPQRLANMARSCFFAVCLMITRMFMLLLIFLNKRNAAMGYDLLLCAGDTIIVL